MPTTQEVITRYLVDVVAAERAMSSQLHDLAQEGDDEDVRLLLTEAADECRLHADAWVALLNEGDPGGLKTAAANAGATLSRLAQIGHIQEERIVQNLIAGYAIKLSACGMYHALSAAARIAGMTSVSHRADDAIEQYQATAHKIFHLIPTRAIIAYNMLTVSEIDLAIDTKYGERSWTG